MYSIAYDVGTTGVKTCLFKLGETIELIASAQAGYGLTVLERGGVEQDAASWWEAMGDTTRELFSKATVRPEQVVGLSFCSQMQGLVLVDAEGNVLRNPMSYMDQRATAEIESGIAYGIQIAGANIKKLIPSLFLTGAVASSVKDPVWKYNWVKRNEPDVYSKIYKWLDVKEYLICRCTGRFVMTEDIAFATFLYDTREHKRRWSPYLCRMLGVDIKHMPEVIKATDCVGTLTEAAAKHLGLSVNTKVFGGGGDASLIGVGAGCTKVGETHIYSGTSGWVSTIVPKQLVDTQAMIAAIIGAESGKYNYFAEMETAGKCLEWVKDHLALDEIDIYLEKKHVAESQESVYTSLYDYLTETVERIPAGCNGVIFTPWLHGNRCPFEDPSAAGMFFNIKLDTGKTELIRAVLEGVCYHLKWMLDCQDRKITTSEVIRFVGGGALSEVTCQMLSDMTGRPIETVSSPQNAGSVGAAAITVVGLGIHQSLETVSGCIPVAKRFEPNEAKHSVYEHQFEVFKALYKTNKKHFRRLNTPMS